jgi:hypothetical protein
MNTAQSDHIEAVRGMEALLSRLLEEIDGGLLTTIENHAIAVTFDDFLDHGAEYLKDGRKNEAAVISASRRARFAVSRDSTSSNVIPDGSTAVVDPDRHRARNPAAHSPVDTRTVPVSAGDAAARCRSSASMACSTFSVAGSSCSPAALRRSPSGSRSNRVGPPKVTSNAARWRAIVG